MAERIVFEGELDLEHLNLIKALSAREMYVEELAQISEGLMMQGIAYLRV